MPLEGFAELTAHGTVRGWAWNSEAPDDLVHLDVFDGGVHFSRTVAEHFDESLKLAGRRGGHCMFEAPVPPVPDGGIHVLVDGTGHRLPMQPAGATEPQWDWLDGPGLPSRPALLLHRLCTELLDRPASLAELQRFGTRTGTGTSLVRLVRDIRDEAPGTGLLTVREVLREGYIGVLGRPADAGGLASFGAAILDGMPVSEFIRTLIGSAEFAAAAAQTAATDTNTELLRLSRALQAAVTTLTLHAAAARGAADARVDG